MIPFNQITLLPPKFVSKKIIQFLREDNCFNDITTKLTVPKNLQCKSNIEAQSDLVFVGCDIINEIFNNCKIQLLVKDGDVLKSGDIIANIDGNAAYILSRERVMLNIIQRLSGIATSARKYSEITKKYNVAVLDTRKTTPGLRLFEKYAVYIGGGTNHRFSLSSNILIKDNHIQAAGGIKKIVDNIIASDADNDIFIELEVDNKEQLIEALELGIKGFLLDNMSPEVIIECVSIIRSHKNGQNIFVEASGGITFDNLEEYAKTGVDAISVGALTHRIVSSDIHMNFL